MKSLFVENSFKRDLKLARKRGRKIELLETLVGELRSGNGLAPNIGRTNALEFGAAFGNVKFSRTGCWFMILMKCR
jgi:hypothetical protein